MMINRRQFLLGTTALMAAAAIPAPMIEEWIPGPPIRRAQIIRMLRQHGKTNLTRLYMDRLYMALLNGSQTPCGDTQWSDEDLAVLTTLKAPTLTLNKIAKKTPDPAKTLHPAA